MSYVVLAEFRAKADRIADFADFIDGHAGASRAEPGCLAFDVCQDAEDPALFVFYEAYDDEAAYRAHRETPHYGRYFDTAEEMLEFQGDTLFIIRRVLTRRPVV